MSSLFYQNTTIESLQASILFCLFLWIIIKSEILIVKILGFLFLAASITIIFVLQSRTAFLASIAGIFYIVFPYSREKFGQWKTLITMLCIFIILTISLTLLIKTDSSLGRWFIWEKSFQLWKENWLSGVGFGRFNPEFNHLQADYFSRTSLYTKEAMLANDGIFAFNEWLHFAIEFGVAGFLLSVATTYFILRTCFNSINSSKSWAGAMLMPVIIGCLFSYPLHNFLY